MKTKRTTKTPTISYILVTKNRSKFLEKTLLNVRDYITKDDELIIIEGGSEDSVKKLIEKNKDIVTRFVMAPDSGEAHAYNKAIFLARGKYIKPITDDDYYYPKTMRLAVKKLLLNPKIEVMMCGGEAYLFDPETGKSNFQIYLKLPSDVSDVHELDNFESSVLCGLGLFIRRDAIARIGLYDLNFRSIDLDYGSRILKSKLNLKYFNVKLYRHVTYPHSNQRDISQSVIDLGKIYLRHGKWEKLLAMDISVLQRVFGFDNSPGARFIKISINIWKLIGLKSRVKTSSSSKRSNTWNRKLY